MSLSLAFLAPLSQTLSYPLDNTSTVPQPNLCISTHLTVKFPIALSTPVVRNTNVTISENFNLIILYFVTTDVIIPQTMLVGEGPMFLRPLLTGFTCHTELPWDVCMHISIYVRLAVSQYHSNAVNECVFLHLHNTRVFIRSLKLKTTIWWTRLSLHLHLPPLSFVYFPLTSKLLTE